MFTDCCIRSFATGESVCPVCQRQINEDRNEKAQARSSHLRINELTQPLRTMVERGIVPQDEAGLDQPITRRIAERNPSRREVFRVLGIYLPETEAREMLKTVHDYKWIEAEKAGFDIWKRQNPKSPFRAAARAWAERYMTGFLTWRGLCRA